MSDVRFEFRGVPRRYRDRIQRAAVLHPLTGLCKTDRAIERNVARLVEIWRARLSRLASFGWFPGSDRSSLTFARNCFPGMVMTTPETRMCQSRICPFCYARRVGTTWERIVTSFPPLPRHGSPFHLVEVRHTFDSEDRIGSEAGQSELRGILNQVIEFRRRFRQRIKPLGGYYTTSIVPRGDGWRVTTNVLLKIRLDHVLPVQLHEASSVERYARPRRTDIFNAVARVCRYPVPLIRGDDPERVILLLDTLRAGRYRMSALLGDFRRSSPTRGRAAE